MKIIKKKQLFWIKLYTICVLNCIFYNNSLFSQTFSFQKNNISIEPRVMYGFVLAHHRYIMHLSKAHFVATDVSFAIKTNGNRSWHKLYNFPEMGLGYYYSNLGNQPILGQAHAIYPYMNFPLRQTKKLNINFRFATGLGYLTNKFDRFENYKNVAISTNFNLFINLSYEVRFKLTERFCLTTGIGLTHFSNGSLKTPNLGINIPSINSSMQYKFNNNKIVVKNSEKEIYKKNEIIAYTIFGIKEIYPPCGEKYKVYLVGFNYNRVLNSKRKIGFGYDISYNEANLEQLKRDSIILTNNFQKIKHGVLLSHELDFGKLAFIFQTGYYIYNKNKKDSFVFSRLAFRYPIYKKIFLNASIKTHFFKADCLEWGAGYKF